MKGLRLLAASDVVPLARHIYANREGYGCCLHVVLDDNNLEDEFVAGSIELAQKRGHGDCETLARILLRMTRTQRGRVARRIHEF